MNIVSTWHAAAPIPDLPARSLENPSTPLSAPDDWLFDALGSYRSTSGVNVNHQTALTYGYVWRAVGLISRDVAKLPCRLYKRIPPTRVQPIAGKAADPKHPAYKLLLRKPNPEITAFPFRQVLQTHALLVGNGYAYIERNGAGRPIELWPLNPIKTYPIREDGVQKYVTEMQTGKERKLPRDRVFHIKGLSWEGQVGLLFITKARECLGLGMALDTYASVFFRNHARPNVVLKTLSKLSEEARRELRESFDRMHAQIENAHRTAVLSGGVDLIPLQVNARDSQLVEQRARHAIEVANWFHLPPHKLGDSSRTSFNSLEQENQSYLDECLDPWLCLWEEEAWDKLLTDEEKDADSHQAQFDRRVLVQANLQARTAYYTAAVTGGWLCPDEIREREGDNPRPDGEGGKYLQPLNMKTPGEPAADEEPEPPKKAKKKKNDDEDRAARALILDAAGRMTRRLAVHACKASRKPAEFLRWLDGMAGEHAQVLSEIMSPPLEAVRRTLTDPSASSEVLAAGLCDSARALLLEVAGRATAGHLAGQVDRATATWEALEPAMLADRLFARKADQAARTTEEALEILKRLPDAAEDKPGEVALTMPVDEKPPFEYTAANLPDFDTKTVKIRELIATRATLKRARLESFIKDPDQKGSTWNIGGGRPLDKAYVVQCKGKRYVYDGHHRLMARQLLGTAKTKVYYHKED